MKQSINKYQFIDSFTAIRPENFSYAGLSALFEYLESYEDDTGTEIELDVIALCCDYTESTVNDFIADYIYQVNAAGKENIFNIDVYEELLQCADDAARLEVVQGYIECNSQFITVIDSNTFIYQAF